MMYCCTLPIFLLLGQVEWSLGSGPPLLNVTDEHVAKLDEEFNLRCEGSQELHWNVPHIVEDEVYEIIHTEHPGDDSPYVSVLKIREPLSFDTGYFRCFYSGAGNLETDNENVDSTYIYFSDGKAKFPASSGHNYLNGYVTKNIVMPCNTNLPNISVTLLKVDDQEEITVVNTTRLKTFDPKVGFELTGLVKEDKGRYICHSDSIIFDLEFHVEIKNGTETPQCKPIIMQGWNIYPVVGYRFTLECLLLNKDEVTFNWLFPKSSDELDYNETNFTRNEDGHQYQVSRLMLFNATQADSGDYTCTVTLPGPGNKQCKDTKSVNVTETPQCKPSIMQGWNIYPVMGYRFTLECLLLHKDEVTFNWLFPKSNDELDYNESIFHRDEGGHRYQVSRLTLFNTTQADSGDYTCTVTLPGPGNKQCKYTQSVNVTGGVIMVDFMLTD